MKKFYDLLGQPWYVCLIKAMTSLEIVFVEFIWIPLKFFGICKNWTSFFQYHHHIDLVSMILIRLNNSYKHVINWSKKKQKNKEAPSVFFP